MNPLRTNLDLRNKIVEYNLFYYEVADVLNMKPSNFSVMLKTQLTELKRNKILEAIEEASRRKEQKNE